MMNTSLFDTLEDFSLQPEMALDEPFGLSPDVFTADLDDYLDIQLGLDNGLKPEVHSQKSLEDMLFPETTGDAFGDDWMETVNISSFLDNQPSSSVASLASNADPPKATVELKVKQEARLEGLKPSAYELLKMLLTTDASVPQPVTDIQPVSSVPSSPEAEVPKLSANLLVSTPDVETFLSGSGGQSDPLSLATDVNCYEIQPVVALDNGDVAEIGPAHLDPFMDLLKAEPLCDEMESVLSSPASPDESITLHPIIVQAESSFADCDSSLSSAPASPDFLLTINSSHLHSEASNCSDKSSQISDNEFTLIKTRSVKDSRKEAHSKPYTKPVAYEKKDRKRVQNKNAATRYREKKRSEKDTMFEQERALHDRNKELREKVDSLHREIAYMKELMQEIQKAKLSKI